MAGAAMTGNFGMQQLSEHAKGGGYSGKTTSHLHDGIRGATTPITHTRGKLPAQAAPDHGPSV